MQQREKKLSAEIMSLLPVELVELFYKQYNMLNIEKSVSCGVDKDSMVVLVSSLEEATLSGLLKSLRSFPVVSLIVDINEYGSCSDCSIISPLDKMEGNPLLCGECDFAEWLCS